MLAPQDKTATEGVAAALEIIAAATGADGIALLDGTGTDDELAVVGCVPAGLAARQFPASQRLMQMAGQGEVPSDRAVLPAAVTRWLGFIAARVCLHPVRTEGSHLYLLLCWQRGGSADGLAATLGRVGRFLPALVDHHASAARRQVLADQLDAIMNKVALGIVLTSVAGVSTINPVAAQLLGLPAGTGRAADVAAAMERMRSSCEIRQATLPSGGPSAPDGVRSEQWLLPGREKVLNVESHPVGDRTYAGRFWLFSDVTALWRGAEELRTANGALQESNALLEREVSRRAAAEQELRRYTENLELSHSSVERRAQELAELAERLAEQKRALEISKQDSDYLASHDPLTGLLNRRGFDGQLGRMIGAAEQSAKQVAVMFIDLDKFKQVNDTLGHDAGDRVLCQAARALTDALREGDVVARLGGDEFAIATLWPGDSDPAIFRLLAGRIRAALQTRVTAPQGAIEVGATLGLACYPRDAGGGEQLLQRADQAMYEGKRRGRNVVVSYSELSRAA